MELRVKRFLHLLGGEGHWQNITRRAGASAGIKESLDGSGSVRNGGGYRTGTSGGVVGNVKNLWEDSHKVHSRRSESQKFIGIAAPIQVWTGKRDTRSISSLAACAITSLIREP